MIFISHRGNLNGPNPLENKPSYVEDAIKSGYGVEVDLWKTKKGLYLGHDEPKYKVSYKWLIDSEALWIHCKNIDALDYMTGVGLSNYFWHQNDDYTLTSAGYIWTFPGKKLTRDSICVIPEKEYNGNLRKCAGICSDYIAKYYQELKIGKVKAL